LGAFGEKLRKQREQRGISLDAISTTTKISPRMLRAIEEEHFDQLPGGVFNKGFVRAYARQIGLDEEEAISDYLAALRESQIQSQPTLPNFRQSNDNPITETEERHGHGTTNLRSHHLENSPAANSTSDRRTQIDDRRKQARRNTDREARQDESRSNADHPEKTLDEVAHSSPLSFLNLTSDPPSAHNPPESDREPIAPAASTADDPSRRVPWGKLAAALLLITLALALWTLRRRSQPAAASHPAATFPTTQSPAVQAPVPASAKPSAVTTSPAAKHSSTSVVPANHPAAIPPDPDLNPPASKPNAHETTAKPPLKFTLLIRADQTSWVSITADGQPVAHETLIAPAHTSVRASHEITVRVGNSAGISFLLDGKEIPPAGNPGEVRTFIFDATGLRASAVAQPANAAR
jgi:hypothetical protein